MSKVMTTLRGRRTALVTTSSVLLLAAVASATPGAFGAYSAKVRNTANTAASAPYFRCADALAADKGSALFQWPLSDGTGATSATDVSGKDHPGSYSGTIGSSSATPLACPRDGGTAWQLDGSTQTAVYPTQQTNPTTFTVEIWFKTTVKGGKLIGFGTQTGASGQYDRHLYIDKNGAVVFGVYANAVRTLVTTGTNYADGAWHFAAATLSSAGMTLSVDGSIPLTDTATTTAENDSGYWKVGVDTLGGSWPNVATNAFVGSLRYAAVYSTALSTSQLAAHYAAGTGR